MRILSSSWTIVASSSAAVFLKGALPDIDAYSHPPLTVLDLPDDEAKRLIADGFVEPHDPEKHDKPSQQRVARRQSPRGVISRPDAGEGPGASSVTHV